MDQSPISSLIENHRPVYIWGARAIGCGILRLAERSNLSVRGFIDSDPAFRDRRVFGREVYPPDHLRKRTAADKPYVIVASTTSDDVISRLCEQMGLEKTTDFCTGRELCQFEYVVDVVGVCNLACPSCPRGNYPVQPSRGVMSTEIFSRVIQKILQETPQVGVVSLYNWGEPLLHPNLTELIGILREEKIFSSLSTNFNVEKDVEEIVASGLDMLKVSVSGFHQDRYASTHRRGNIERVKANLVQLRQARDRLNSDMEVEIIYHKYRDNVGEDLEKFKSLAEELNFHFAEVFAYFMPVEKILDYLQQKVTESDLKLIGRLAVDIRKALRLKNNEEHRKCPLREKQIVINWDGSVSLCCASFDPRQTTVVDSFLDTPLNKIQALRQGNRLCKDCLHYGIDQYYFETSQRDG